jgi:hypothetical protein
LKRLLNFTPREGDVSDAAAGQLEALILSLLKRQN